WSSDVCSSDLLGSAGGVRHPALWHLGLPQREVHTPGLQGEEGVGVHLTDRAGLIRPTRVEGTQAGKAHREERHEEEDTEGQQDILRGLKQTGLFDTHAGHYPKSSRNW